MPRCEKCHAEWTLSNTLEQECPACGHPYDPGSLSEIEDFLLDDDAEVTLALRDVQPEDDGPDTRPPLTGGEGPADESADEAAHEPDEASDPDFTMVFGGKFDEDSIDLDDDFDAIALDAAPEAGSSDSQGEQSDSSHVGDTTRRPDADLDPLEATHRLSDLPSLADDPFQGGTLPEMTRLVGDTDPGLRSPATPAGGGDLVGPIEATQAIGDSSQDEPSPSSRKAPLVSRPDVTQAVGDGSSRRGDSSGDATNRPPHDSSPEVTQNLSGDSSERPEATMAVGQGSDSGSSGVGPSGSGSGSSSQDADTLVPDSATMKRGTDRPSSLVQTPRSRDITGLGSGHTTPGGALGERPSVSLKAGDTHMVQHESIRLRAFKLSKDEKPPTGDDNDYTRTGGPFKGGMGYVYRMRQTSLDRNVAVKQVKPDMATNESDRNKLITEGVITARLEHPNIVPVHDLGIASDGQPFYVMKFVEGQEWEKLIGKYTEQENLEVLLKVCQAVAFAHSHNVINRDLKPGNVMIGAFGEVLVMDWGLAARIDREQEIPPGGTPLYMPPETALEYLDSIKHKTVNLSEGPSKTRRVKAGKYCDIYLLGAQLFKVITGKPPHTGKNTFDCLKNAARNRLVKVDRSSELLDIAYKAMATEPEDRYATVGDFIDAIKAYQEHAQSLLITRRASEDLELAENKKTDASAKSTDKYALFSSAEHGFKNALELWPDNHKARRQLDKTLHAFADTAYQNGDYDLSLSMLDERRKDDEQLRSDVLRSQKQRKARLAWFRTLQYATAASLAAALVFIGVSIVMGRDAFQQRKVATAAKLEAVGALADAKQAKNEADAAQQQATLAKSEAVQAAEEAKVAKAEALRAKQDTDVALAEAADAKQQAVAAAGEAKVAKDEAESAKLVAATEKQKADEAASAAEVQKHLARVAGIEATLIKDGAYPAWQLLQQAGGLANPDAEKFDWKVLAKRCNWTDEGYELPIDAASSPVLATTADGGRLAIAAADPDGGFKLSVRQLAGLPTPDGGAAELPKDQLVGLAEMALPAAPRSLALSEDGSLAAVVVGDDDQEDGRLLLFDVSAGVAIPLAGDGAAAPRARHVAFGRADARNPSADAYLLVGAGSDVREYRIDREPGSATRLATVDGSLHLADIASVAYSSDGLLAASADQQGKVAVWRTTDRDRFVADTPAAGQPRKQGSAAPWTYSHADKLSTSPHITSMAFAPTPASGKPALAYGCDDGNVFVLQGPWRSTPDPIAGEKGGSLVEYISELPAQLAGGHSGPVTDLLVTLRKVRVADGDASADRYLVVSAGADGRALVRDSRLDMQEATPAYVKVERRYHDAPLVQAVVAADGAIITRDEKGRVVRWLVDVAPDSAGLIASDDAPVGPVTSIRYDDAGDELVVGDAAGMTRVWPLKAQRTPEKYFVGHEDHAGMRAWLTGDNQQIATVAADHRLCLWDAETGLIEAVFPLDERPVVEPSADGLGVVAATDRRDTAAELVGLDGSRAPLWNNRPRVSAVADLGAGRLAVGLRDGQVYLWDRNLGRTELVSATVRPHWRPIAALVVDPATNVLFSADRAGRIARWDLDSPQQARPPMTTIRSESPDAAAGVSLERLTLSPSGERLLAIVRDDATSWPALVDAKTLEPGPELPPLASGVADACFDLTGESILAVDRASRAWELRPGAADWLPASTGSMPSVNRVARQATGEPVFAGPGVVLRGVGAPAPIVRSRPPVAFVGRAPGGVVAFDDAGHVTKWTGHNPEQTAAARGGGLACCPFSPGPGLEVDGALIVRLHDATLPVGRLDLWDSNTGQRIAELGETPGGECTAIASSTGMVAMATKSPLGPTILLRLPDGKLAPILPPPAGVAGAKDTATEFVDLAFSPSGRELIAVDDVGTARLLTLGPTGWISRVVEGEDFSAARFSPDGSRLVLGGKNGQLFVAVAEPRGDGVSLRTVLTLAGHSARITFLDFAQRDGHAMLLSGDASGKAMTHVSG
ncbi:Serine/threonine-protein kinase PknB [Pirellulimonas nuda]|uniref:Serine/threonine-protein kinase PknB n=1 Tax=Pirellulimonas nuda TaxID=2528009 RepID=A0A518DAN7_9BACT|nr:protein kinase [Pirellulimonas nuda]QDU88486.1 Serine/threonine-protein kinase PknB [Pirellulimonas nuda]